LKRFDIDTVSVSKLNLGLATRTPFLDKTVPFGIAPLCRVLVRHRVLLMQMTMNLYDI
jgi:hypothetical protein